MRLTNDMGLEEVQEYANKLKKAEKMREAREQVCLCPSSLIRFTRCYILFFFFVLEEILFVFHFVPLTSFLPVTTEVSESTYL